MPEKPTIEIPVKVHREEVETDKPLEIRVTVTLRAGPVSRSVSLAVGSEADLPDLEEVAPRLFERCIAEHARSASEPTT